MYSTNLYYMLFFLKIYVTAPELPRLFYPGSSRFSHRCLPRTHPTNRHLQPFEAAARRIGRDLVPHPGTAGSLHEQRSRKRGAHAYGQTQDHGRVPDSSGSTGLLCRSFLSLHSEEAATSVIDSTPGYIQWRRPALGSEYI